MPRSNRHVLPHLVVAVPVLLGACGTEAPPHTPDRSPQILAESAEFVHSLTLQVSAASAELSVHYTLDGSDPTPQSPRADGPITVRTSCTVKAASFHRGAVVSGIAERRFRQVVPQPPVHTLRQVAGLNVQHFAADWQRIPDDRNHLTEPEARTIAEAVVLPKDVGEHRALCFRGFLQVPADDVYRFALTSDDGSKLWLGGELVVDNDGPHRTAEQRGAIALGQGLHPLELWWWNQTGESSLSLQWARPGQPFVPVPPSALWH